MYTRKFEFERRRTGWFINSWWFFLRFYPGTLPRIYFHWKPKSKRPR